MELADRLAISVGIDWSDKKNTGSVTEPASNQLLVRIPISNLEGRENTARVSEVAGMAGRPFDLTNEIAI